MSCQKGQQAITENLNTIPTTVLPKKLPSFCIATHLPYHDVISLRSPFFIYRNDFLLPVLFQFWAKPCTCSEPGGVVDSTKKTFCLLRSAHNFTYAHAHNALRVIQMRGVRHPPKSRTLYLKISVENLLKSFVKSGKSPLKSRTAS